MALKGYKGMADEVEDLKTRLKEARVLLDEARTCLVIATGQEGTDGLFTLGRMNIERDAVRIWDRIGHAVRAIDAALRLNSAPQTAVTPPEDLPWWTCLWCRREMGHCHWCDFRPGAGR